MREIVEIGTFVARAIAGVLPAFLLSVTLGVLIRALQLDGLIRRAVEARAVTAVVLATGVGAFSPLCSCTVVPVVSGLLLGGVPLAPVMAFWIASPTMDPEMFALTVATLGWPLATARLLATLALSLGAGFLTLLLGRAGVVSGDLLRRPRPRPRPEPATRPLLATAPLRPLPLLAGARGPITGGSDAPAGGCCGAAAAGPRAAGTGGAPAGAASPGAGWRAGLAARLRAIAWPRFGRDVATEGWRLGRWLVVAFVLEALMTRYVPQAAIAGILGEGNVLAVVLAALVGIPLYLNNVSALPIVSGLLAQGMQPGAAVAFLIAGPVTTIPAMSAVWGVVRPQVFALYLGLSLAGAIALGYVTNGVLG